MYLYRFMVIIFIFGLISLINFMYISYIYMVFLN